jgi:hypothetical protein
MNNSAKPSTPDVSGGTSTTAAVWRASRRSPTDDIRVATTSTATGPESTSIHKTIWTARIVNIGFRSRRRDLPQGSGS